MGVSHSSFHMGVLGLELRLSPFAGDSCLYLLSHAAFSEGPERNSFQPRFGESSRVRCEAPGVASLGLL